MTKSGLLPCNDFRLFKIHLFIPLLLLLSAAGPALHAQSPADSASKRQISITHTDQILKREGDAFQRFVGSVVIQHDGFTMTCDSAFLFAEKNYVEAFGNVNIAKTNGTNVRSDYMRYSGSNSTALMKGAVSIVDGNNSLFTEEVTYNLRTKIGKYTQGGTLSTEGTTVNSKVGNYSGYSQQAWFRDSVVVSHPDYTIESKELSYLIKSKTVKLLDESVVTTASSTIWSKSGTYNAKTKQAVFNARTTVESDGQIIIGNVLWFNDSTGQGRAKGDVYVIDTKNETKLTAPEVEYNRQTGFGKAIGGVRIESEGGRNILNAQETEYNKKTGYAIARVRVSVEDTAQKSRLLAGVVKYNEFTSFMLATEKPKLLTLADGDSLFMRADTMFSLRIRDLDKLKWVPEVRNGKKEKVQPYGYSLLFADSTWRSENPDSAEPKMIIANRNIRLFSDSMQAVCDSLSYSQQDSTFRLYKNPVMWSRNQQAVADTVFLLTSDNALREAQLRRNALLVNPTGYEDMMDQVSGVNIDAFFENNALQKVQVDQNAESIYYAKDEEGAFIGLNRAESAEMQVYFHEKEVDHIVFLTDPKGKFIPIDQVNEGNRTLGTLRLFPERRPKSKEEVMSE